VAQVDLTVGMEVLRRWLVGLMVNGADLASDRVVRHRRQETITVVRFWVVLEGGLPLPVVSRGVVVVAAVYQVPHTDSPLFSHLLVVLVVLVGLLVQHTVEPVVVEAVVLS